MANGTRISLLRPYDLLCLDFELVNLDVDAARSRLVRVDAAADALIIVHFPPQALAEATFTGDPPQPPIGTALSGPSRLVFRIDDDELPLTTEALLNFGAWQPVLAPTALPRGTGPAPEIPAPAMATDQQTSIEFPWRLTLSPDETATWRTDTAATSSPRGQLWSAVLLPPADVRALGSFGGLSLFDSLPGEFSRDQIVKLTSNFHLPVPGGEFTPLPLTANRLELTALGANADLEGLWDYPLVPPEQQPPGFDPIGLRQYQHTAGLGRDHFVRTVKVGWLCGTGHQAVVVTTVQRLPVHVQVVAHRPEGALFSSIGYLIETVDVVVQQPRLDYGPLAPAFAHHGRELPLASIRLTTLTARVHPVPENEPVWLRNPDGSMLMFDAVATDVTGATVRFALPLMFVPFEALDEYRAIRAEFDRPEPEVRAGRRIDLAGQALSVAPHGDRAGSTVLTMSTITYDIEQPPWPGNPRPDHLMNAAGAPSTYLPRFLMRIDGLTASSPAIGDLLGGARPVELTLSARYLQAGFDGGLNPAQTFADFVTPLPLALPSQRGGGLAGVDTAVRALSRTLGPVAAPEALQTGTVDLSAFAATRLLGTIKLTDLLPDPPLPFDVASAGAAPTGAQLDDPHFVVNPPRLTTRREPIGVAVPDVVETRFLWKPPLRSQTILPSLTLNLDEADLLLDATTRLVRNGPGSTVVFGRLRRVKLTFANALSAGIASLTFRAEAGRKVEFGAGGVDITFEGPLAFVNALRSILPADGFDDPPYVTADAQGVVAGYTLAVPNVGVGIFSIQNIAVAAALSIPFTDRPAGIRFAICERHKPFLVTVSLFGGGGFFAVGVSADGLESVEAAIEFGGSICLNLGVASGGVSVMAGVYFGMTGKSVELTGYLRCGGYLSVLGLISVSLEFYLAFTYRKKTPGGSEIWGQASLTVSVKIAFFSTSVTLSVERRFAGSDGDPSFAQSVTPGEWARYLGAFV
ncbi:hypothetical protein Acy02nite_47490 [Actinoplanes cyaneus]|uniref:Uncharacterized protein n=1 Tax=Actinoplanes cyaneus TaxID=52696 RepID=A0A919INZ4_9ACTN|nr:hypothetical protein [Actinoplanes cyaneus]MCW2138802.1 hypothetical protein [Actinoplanes cyaneus]GID66868.1 hypothetical protein Acy02nite_47490 [Actinoplanes cyaneus]